MGPGPDEAAQSAQESQAALNVRRQELVVRADEATRLAGLRFRNWFASSVTVTLLGADGAPRKGAPQQRVALTGAPHAQDTARESFSLALSGELRRALAQAALEAAPSATLTLSLELVQASPLLRHRAPALEHITPILDVPDALRDAQQRKTTSASPPSSSSAAASALEIANQQLGLHLAVLEGLRMRKLLRRRQLELAEQQRQTMDRELDRDSAGASS
jgi:hypothetical protein